MAYKKINSLEELKQLTSNHETIDIFIWLGCARSSKEISWDGDNKWFVYNEIDDTEIECTTEELKTETNIIEAIENDRLYLY